MRVPPTLPSELQQSLRELWQSIDRMSGSRSVDLHGRKFLNAGEAIASDEFITKADLERLLSPDQISLLTGGSGTGTSAATAPSTMSGTHAERLIAGMVRGLRFFETDRTVTYVVNEVSGSLVWNVASGVMVGLEGGQPNDLGAADVGFRYDATDTYKGYRWTGTAWQFWIALEQPDTYPGTPTYPTPTDGATGVSTSPTLAWTLTDGTLEQA